MKSKKTKKIILLCSLFFLIIIVVIFFVNKNFKNNLLVDQNIRISVEKHVDIESSPHYSLIVKWEILKDGILYKNSANNFDYELSDYKLDFFEIKRIRWIDHNADIPGYNNGILVQPKWNQVIQDDKSEIISIEKANGTKTFYFYDKKDMYNMEKNILSKKKWWYTINYQYQLIKEKNKLLNDAREINK